MRRLAAVAAVAGGLLVLPGCGSSTTHTAAGPCAGVTRQAAGGPVLTRSALCSVLGAPSTVTSAPGGREIWSYAVNGQAILLAGDRVVAIATQPGPSLADARALRDFARDRRLSPGERAAVLALAEAVERDPAVAARGGARSVAALPAQLRRADAVCLRALVVLHNLSQGPGPAPFASGAVLAAAQRASAIIGADRTVSACAVGD